MGYSNETTHYGIPLPTGSDLTTPMDYNESMTDIDVAVFEAKTDSDSALTKAGQLEVALGETNEAVSGIDTRLTEAEGTITSQGLAITNNANDIIDARQDLSDAICAIVEVSATATYNHIVGGEKPYFWYNNTLYKVKSDIHVGDQIVPDTNCETTTVTSQLGGLGVFVVADGVKTYAQLLNELHQRFDYNSVTEKTTFRVGANIFQINSKDSGTCKFNKVRMDGTTLTLTSIKFATASEVTDGVTDVSANVLPNGTRLSILY